MDKDYTRLRPFDPEKAKAGEALRQRDSEVVALAARVAEMLSLLNNAMGRYDQWLIDDNYDANRELTAMAYVVRRCLATPDDSAAILARRDARTILECAELSPNDLNISAGDSPAEVWIKFRDALRNRAAELEGVKS